MRRIKKEYATIFISNCYIRMIMILNYDTNDEKSIVKFWIEQLEENKRFGTKYKVVYNRSYLQSLLNEQALKYEEV